MLANTAIARVHAAIRKSSFNSNLIPRKKPRATVHARAKIRRRLNIGSSDHTVDKSPHTTNARIHGCRDATRMNCRPCKAQATSVARSINPHIHWSLSSPCWKVAKPVGSSIMLVKNAPDASTKTTIIATYCGICRGSLIGFSSQKESLRCSIQPIVRRLVRLRRNEKVPEGKVTRGCLRDPASHRSMNKSRCDPVADRCHRHARDWHMHYIFGKDV